MAICGRKQGAGRAVVDHPVAEKGRVAPQFVESRTDKVSGCKACIFSHSDPALESSDWRRDQLVGLSMVPAPAASSDALLARLAERANDTRFCVFDWRGRRIGTPSGDMTGSCAAAGQVREARTCATDL